MKSAGVTVFEILTRLPTVKAVSVAAKLVVNAVDPVPIITSVDEVNPA
jgi:hypothetical protein